MFGSFLNPCVCLLASINTDNDRFSVAPVYTRTDSCIKILHFCMLTWEHLQDFSFIRAKSNLCAVNPHWFRQLNLRGIKYFPQNKKQETEDAALIPPFLHEILCNLTLQTHLSVLQTSLKWFARALLLIKHGKVTSGELFHEEKLETRVCQAQWTPHLSFIL